ncbi:S9 family peptidase [Paenibacillus sp. FSL R5-0527]|uniref:S9 family peptidase n=1 Tax=Paenibacillus sp. FSL R5-0527 TaxID=2975321 RepID=UPI00097B35AF|nr:hypothetical protein BK140_02565 [Paenibacillus macerans]
MRYERRLTSEDLFNLRAVNDPQISPDGSRIAYVESIMDRHTNKYKSRIWVVSTSGNDEPRPLTSGLELDYAPRWSPDGQFISFISGRSGSRQLWIMRNNGEEPRLFSHVGNVAGVPVWSPDGRTIACIIRLSAGDKEREEEQALNPRARFSQNVLVIDQLRYKLDSVGFLVNKNWHLFTVQVKGTQRGVFQQLTFGNNNFSSPAWSPDGRFIAVAGNRISARTELDLVNDIWVIPSGGGVARRLTRSAGPAIYPSWSPDGRFIAYIGHDRKSGYYTNRGIWIVPLDGGEPRELTVGFKYPVGDYAIKDFLGIEQPGVTPHWSPDGKSIFMNVSANGTVHLWRFSVPDGQGKQLTHGELVIYNLSFSLGTRRAAMAVTAFTLPNDIWVGEITEESVNQRRITRVNRNWLDHVKLARPTRFTFRSPGGPEEEGWILHPPYSTGEKHPGILQIHGGPSAMYGYVFFFEFQLLASNGFAVIFVNPRGSMGYGQELADAIRGDWGNHDYADLMAAVDTALSRGTLDPGRLGVAGGSYGGYMTNWIVTQTNRFKAAVSMRGISNLYSFFGTSDGGFLRAEEYGGPPWELPKSYLRRSPISFVDKVKTPLLLIHSDRDFRVPIEQGEQFYTALKFLQRKVRMVRFLTETHELSREGEPWHRVVRLDHILQWFRDHLKKTTMTAHEMGECPMPDNLVGSYPNNVLLPERSFQMSFSQNDYSIHNYVFETMPQLDLSDANAEMSRLQPVLQQIPLASPSFRQAMGSVLQHLQIVSRALALGCGMSSEFRYLPEAWGLPELHIVHSRYLTPLSYHLYSALGAAELLAAGRGRYSHFPLAVGCMLSIIRLWQTFPEALANLRRAAGPRYAAAIDQAEQTLRQMVPPTQQALTICRSIVEPAVWDATVRASQLAYEVRGRVAKSMGQEMY